MKYHAHFPLSDLPPELGVESQAGQISRLAVLADVCKFAFIPRKMLSHRKNLAF